MQAKGLEMGRNDWYHMGGERELETGDDGRWAPSGRSGGGTEGR